MDKKIKHRERKELQLPKNISRHEEKMIRELLSLIKTPLSRIMVPKTEMTSIAVDKKIKNLFKLFQDFGFSRIPVFSGALDNIVGVVHLKDIFRITSSHPEGKIEEMPVVEFVRLPHFIFEDMNGLDAFLELQRRKVSLALVVDEFGRTVGLVTLEDLLEEVVGEIGDEFEQRKLSQFIRMADGRYVFDPRIELDKFSEAIGAELPSLNVSTLAGLIYHLADRIPKVGDRIKFESWELTILEGTSRKITKVLVEKK